MLKILFANVSIGHTPAWSTENARRNESYDENKMLSSCYGELCGPNSPVLIVYRIRRSMIESVLGRQLSVKEAEQHMGDVLPNTGATAVQGEDQRDGQDDVRDSVRPATCRADPLYACA